MEVEVCAKFPLGNIVATPRALSALVDAGQQPEEFLSRHALCDWGDMGEQDREMNDQGVVSGERLHSSYTTRKDVVIWVITEADRSTTTILLSSDY